MSPGWKRIRRLQTVAYSSVATSPSVRSATARDQPTSIPRCPVDWRTLKLRGRLGTSRCASQLIQNVSKRSRPRRRCRMIEAISAASAAFKGGGNPYEFGIDRCASWSNMATAASTPPTNTNQRLVAALRNFGMHATREMSKM